MEPAIVVVLLVILIGLIFLFKFLCGDAFDTASQSTAIPTAPQATNDNLTEQERREERRFRILTSVVHKKVIAKTNDNNDITLPHEEEISHRSLRKEYDEEDPIEQDSQTTEESNEAENQELNNKYKTDIALAASERLSSWRSLRKKSDRLSGLSNREESLYSPRTCPICLESYKEGDEICWSKNEKCPHAFHLDCMTEWLMENDDCPMCRESYLEDSI